MRIRRLQPGMKLARSVAITLLCSLLLTACAGTDSSTSPNTETTSTSSPTVGGQLKVAINTEPPTLDWTSTTATITSMVAWHMFEQLFAIAEDFTIKPMLAEGYEVSTDGLTYTINLRRGVKFHNGKTMTADDVISSIERWGRISATGKATFKHIDSIKKVDDYTITIRLKNPYSSLIPSLADPAQALIIVPSEITAASGGEPLRPDLLIGTGPFMFETWIPGQAITLKRFDDYSARNEDWGGLTGRKTAYVDEIQFIIVKDPQVRLSGLQTGQYDVAINLQPDMYAQVDSTPGVNPAIIKTFIWRGIVFNKKSGVFSDIRLRRAVNYAMDKSSLARNGIGNPMFWQLDPGIFFPQQRELYTKVGEEVYNAYDPEKAKQLLKRAGYSGAPVRILTTKDYWWNYSMSQELARQLSNVGFAVDVQVYDWATLLELRTDPEKWDIFLTGFPPTVDVSTVTWLHPSWPGWYESTRMQSLLKRWVTVNKEREKRVLLEDIQRTVYDELPVIKVANEFGFQAYRDHVRGFKEFVDARFWNVWLEKR